MLEKIKHRFTLNTKRKLTGYLFTLPFVIGFILFFLYPFLQSIIFSLNKLSVVSEGYVLEYVGLNNYYHALVIDANFVPSLSATIVQLLIDVPAILVFSLFAALLLNHEFRGRLLARMIFFLPVIIGAEVVHLIEQGDYMQQVIDQAIEEQGLEGMFMAVENILLELRLPDIFLGYLIDVLEYIPQIINSSAIQILIFLAALQSIDLSLYEVARIEGANGWERFWKVTFPMISPLLLVNTVYTVIDSFTSPYNAVIQLIQKTAWGGAGYGVSAAMAWVFFISIMVILGVVIKIVSRKLYYEV
ncbi:MAG: carbohydrate ABC transporter permease [bacterium]